jgi:hypothetical protein
MKKSFAMFLITFHNGCIHALNVKCVQSKFRDSEKMLCLSIYHNVHHQLSPPSLAHIRHSYLLIILCDLGADNTGKDYTIFALGADFAPETCGIAARASRHIFQALVLTCIE